MMTAEQYQQHIATYVRIGRDILEENPTADINNELHQWLNAPDSFFNWTPEAVWSEEATENVALDVLRHSKHRRAAPERDTSDFVYLAAWAFVADVEAALEGALAEELIS